MSSLNESTEFTSQNDSIPVDVAPSGTGTSEDRTSYDPYDDTEVDPYDEEEEDFSDGASRSQTLNNASASYVTGRSGGATPSQTTRSRGGAGSRRGLGASSAGDGYTGISEGYDQTGYGSRSEATSGSFYGDYSSGYDVGGSTSYGYDDTSIRSPRSGSEMSSTFASFYYDNEYMVRIRRTLNFFRRPIYFFLFSVAGSGAAGGLCQAVRILTKSVRIPDPVEPLSSADVSGVMPTSAPAPTVPTGLPSGYPNVPDWLREVRASLPAAVEKPVAWTLERHGVPVLSELQQASQGVLRNVVSRLQEAVELWHVSGPMIPPGVFLPLFTFGALHIASKVMARRNYQDSADYEFFGSASQYNDDVRNGSGLTPDSRTRMSGISNTFSVESPPQGSPPSGESNFLGSTLPTAVRASGPGSLVDSADHLGKPVLTPAKGGNPNPADLPQRFTIALQTPEDDASDDVERGEEEGDRSRSRSRTQAPQTARHPAGFTSEGPVPVERENAEELPDSPSALGLSPVGVPPSGGRDAVSPAPALPSASAATAWSHTPLQGDVAVAVVGAPSVAEANAVLVAAAKYGCSAVILPSSLGAADVVASPPSLTVEFVPNVLDRVTALAQRRGLTVSTVFRSGRSDAAVASGAVPLPAFEHRANALYIFLPPAAEAAREASEAAAAAASSVYVSEAPLRQGDSIPANECFYDRLAKERTQS